MHQHVTYKLLRLLAIIMELPDHEALVNGHLDHKDNGTLTYIFQQPIAALQVKRSEETDWEYPRVPADKVAVNVADILEFLSNGCIKAGIHRVVALPQEQANMDRLGLLYFVRPSDRLPLRRLDTPFLARGLGREGFMAKVFYD
ncbi:hypothetical protein E4U21_006702 [Claviceps maximensis]|nr:hypothetical protein E4U21_006702 [Claviceps maximensis]